MDTYVKIAACSVVCAILCAVLKPHEGAISLAISVLCAAGAAIAALGLLSPVLEFFEKLLSYTGLSSAVFSPRFATFDVRFSEAYGVELYGCVGFNSVRMLDRGRSERWSSSAGRCSAFAQGCRLRRCF